MTNGKLFFGFNREQGLELLSLSGAMTPLDTEYMMPESFTHQFSIQLPPYTLIADGFWGFVNRIFRRFNACVCEYHPLNIPDDLPDSTITLKVSLPDKSMQDALRKLVGKPVDTRIEFTLESTAVEFPFVILSFVLSDDSAEIEGRISGALEWVD